ncbi:TraR/DksA C4-type zinc finger protein [Microlunatus sp. Gsoil 973]|jgi:DnaK suppressor protein|uniref:TraR/DksA family transcriptional regulator n=1 Tax=Microlunatus sp. Gsoil 973 TaxID=2672569 RepID=UPI0018A7FE96|nr:TraR/DksA C4-type zinc finger protein [Microlunatus sp. Gsoil 973]
MLLQQARQGQASEVEPTAEVSLAKIRAELEQQRDFRMDQIKQLEGDMADTLTSGDEARLQVNRMLAVSADAVLDEIIAALRRLDAGEYGVCEDCDAPIPWERLEVLPMSRLCTPCQYRLDTRRMRGNARSGRRR